MSRRSERRPTSLAGVSSLYVTTGSGRTARPRPLTVREVDDSHRVVADHPERVAPLVPRLRAQPRQPRLSRPSLRASSPIARAAPTLGKTTLAAPALPIPPGTTHVRTFDGLIAATALASW